MWISRLELSNIKCFEKADIDLSEQINVIVGENNSGKSTILNAIRFIQDNTAMKPNFIRLEKSDGSAKIYFQGETLKYYGINVKNISYSLKNPNLVIKTPSGNQGANVIPNYEGKNYIYPHLSKRKVTSFNEQINETVTNQISGDYQNLYAKIDRISNPEFKPAYDEYVSACDQILGFRITASSSGNGKKASYTVKNLERIFLDSMGEGVVNILGLIVDLCVAQENLFLIEEPENDIHPKALKSMLGLILQKSKTNQFIITTHSHIVVSFLAAANTKIFDVSTELKNRLFTSEVKLLGDSVEERFELLTRLGYEPFDLGMWEAWIFFEESSAEKIIKQYLIPWFLPNLCGKVMTYSSHSVSEVEKRVEAFNRIFSYINMEPIYKNKAWIIIDGGLEEEKIITRMKGIYSNNGWAEGHFIQFIEHDFEKYYPDIFQEKIQDALNETNKDAKRKKKKLLLEEVENWIKQDNEEAKNYFLKSAKEVIGILKKIEQEVKKRTVT